MFMYLQKNKKGFTLIELMVVVAIIGILALLGLRMYAGQQRRAKDAIALANASTIHTLIQANLVDQSYAADANGGEAALKNALGPTYPPTNVSNTANLKNPYNSADGTIVAVVGTVGDTVPSNATIGAVYIEVKKVDEIHIRAIGEDTSSNAVWIGNVLKAVK